MERVRLEGGFVLERAVTMAREYVDYLVVAEAIGREVEVAKVVALAEKRGVRVVSLEKLGLLVGDE